MLKRDVVIIGGGPAGRSIVHALRGAGAGLSVTVIKNEPVNVNRCAIPYGVDGAKPLEKYQIPNALVTDFGAELLLDEVSTVMTDAHRLTTVGGQDLEYGHLVFATGARPVIPPIPGVDHASVLSVRSLSDLEQLRHMAAEKKTAVVVGGGYIGVEVAVALRKIGLDVTLVEMLPHVLLMTSEPEFIGDIEATLEREGIRLLTGRRVSAFKEGANTDSLDVRLDNGESTEADFAVLAVGVAPNVELAAAAGLKTSRYGIVTDDFLRTTAPDVYAAGDCVEKKSFLTQQPVRGEFGTNAVFTAKVVAQNMMGQQLRFPGVINTNASTAFERATGSAGLTESAAREAGLNVVTGCSEIPDRYPMMDGLSQIHTKLVFDQSTAKLLGGSVLQRGHGAATSADFISLAIQMGATAQDLVRYQYATHPELAAKPSHNTYVFAAKDALTKLK